jgi:hypothetical protein
MKGSRVQSIIRELRGEKIDIIEYSDDLVTFAQSALAPAKITRVSVTHQGEVPHLDVIVEDEQLSLAIGKRGQNVRLASELIGCRIDIKSESDVKDEVADALARMLQTAIGGPPATNEEQADVGIVAGLSPEIAERLRDAGFATADAVLEARGRPHRGLGRGPDGAAAGGGRRHRQDLPRSAGFVVHGRRGLHGGAQPGLPGERAAARLRGLAGRGAGGSRRGRDGRTAERRISRAVAPENAGIAWGEQRHLEESKTNLWERFESRTLRG